MNKGKFVILFSCFSNICGVFSSHLLDKTTIQSVDFEIMHYPTPSPFLFDCVIYGSTGIQLSVSTINCIILCCDEQFNSII